MRATTVGAVVVCVLAVAASRVAASWQETRTEVVDPIHELLHHAYPDALRTRERAAIEALFAGDAGPSVDLVARFERIDRALAEIETVDLERDPVHARVRVTLEGVARDGSATTVLQSRVMQIGVVPPGASDEGADDHGHAHAHGPPGDDHESAHAHEPPSNDQGYGASGPRWRILADLPEPLEIVPAPRARLVDEAAARGLRFTHHVAEVPDLHGTPQRYIFGSGVATLDVDANGWEDVVLASATGLTLFVNRQGTFHEATAAWGLDAPLAGVPTVVLAFDYDNDGHGDLFIGAENAQPTLLRNDGSSFHRLDATGLRTTERTISAVAADFDGDGRVDLFLANHEDVFLKAPDPPGQARNAEPDQLYLNNGDGTFRAATDAAGIDNTGWSLSPAAADYDLDGDVDLFVGNDFGTDVLYRNDGTGRFDEVSGKAGVDLPVASMSADWGDFDADGDLDLFVGGMRSGSAWVLEVPDFPVDRVPRIVDWMFRSRVREIIRAWFRGNRFYENLGDGTFREIAQESGAQNSGWAWGTVWLDFDNDGRLDLYGANGFISGPLEDDV